MRPGGRRGKQCRLVRFLEAVLLLLLNQGEAHGYSLLEELEDFGLDASSSVVYRALREMEERGWVSSSWEDEDSQGPPRRVYRLTAAGANSLELLVADLRENQRQISHFLTRFGNKSGAGAAGQVEKQRSDRPMRIAISAAGNNLDAASSPTFGRCPYFLVVDTDTMAFEAHSNPAAAASGGAGVQASQFVVKQQVDAVLTGQVGPNAMKVFQQAGTALYQTAGGTVGEEVQRFVDGKLQPLEKAGESHAGMGHASMGRGAAGREAAVQDDARARRIAALSDRAKALRAELAGLLEEIDRLRAEE